MVLSCFALNNVSTRDSYSPFELFNKTASLHSISVRIHLVIFQAWDVVKETETELVTAEMI